MEHVLLGALRLGEGGTCSPEVLRLGEGGTCSPGGIEVRRGWNIFSWGIEVRRGWEHVLLEVLRLGEGENMFSWRY